MTIYQTPGGQRLLDKQEKQRIAYEERTAREDVIRKQLGQVPQAKHQTVYAERNTRQSYDPSVVESKMAEIARLREQERKAAEAEARSRQVAAEASERNQRESGPAFREYWNAIIDKAPTHKIVDAQLQYAHARGWVQPGGGWPGGDTFAKVRAELNNPVFIGQWDFPDGRIRNYVFDLATEKINGSK